MSARKMQITYLATKIAEAVAMDETDEAGGCDLSAGMFGPNMSQLIRDLVDEFNHKDEFIEAGEIVCLDDIEEGGVEAGVTLYHPANLGDKLYAKVK